MAAGEEGPGHIQEEEGWKLEDCGRWAGGQAPKALAAWGVGFMLVACL